MSKDALKQACGAFLAQMHGNAELPVAYASKNLTKGKSNKSTIEQELTVIHWQLTISDHTYMEDDFWSKLTIVL